ncbi:hypothetical protein PFWH6_2089 [Pseudomonas fluorescens WH6]|nr:hypothetical protein PFWH6_2089 [Pseudomonas fluorescens WH6]
MATPGSCNCHPLAQCANAAQHLEQRLCRLPRTHRTRSAEASVSRLAYSQAQTARQHAEENPGRALVQLRRLCLITI